MLQKLDFLTNTARSGIKAGLEGVGCTQGPEVECPDLIGVFVTLYDDRGQLRGCMGRFEKPTDLMKMVCEMAQVAAFEDPRFPPVNRAEADSLKVEISLMHSMERVWDLADLDPGVYGVSVRSGFRHGVLLPGIASVTTVDEQLRIAMAKGGIRPTDNPDIYRFQVHKIKEED